MVTPGSELVVWSPIRRKVVKIRDRYIVVYDFELLMMFIKQWRDGGMSREDVEDLLLS